MKVMIPLDYSEGSIYALKWALDHLFRRPTVSPQDSQDPDIMTVVHVQEPFQPFIFPAGPVGYPVPAVVDGVKKAQQENSLRIIGRALQMCKEKKIKAESLILEGDPKDRICQAADEIHFDLLVIGSRGLGKIKRAFLGSVSDYCVHHVNCPILIVKPPKEPNV